MVFSTLSCSMFISSVSQLYLYIYILIHFFLHYRHIIVSELSHQCNYHQQTYKKDPICAAVLDFTIHLVLSMCFMTNTATNKCFT